MAANSGYREAGDGLSPEPSQYEREWRSSRGRTPLDWYGSPYLTRSGEDGKSWTSSGMNAGLRCFGRGFRFRSRSMNGGLHGVPSLMVLCQFDI